MRVRVWDKELRVFWNILRIDFDEAGKPIGFEGFRWDNGRQIRIDMNWSDNFELRGEI